MRGQSRKALKSRAPSFAALLACAVAAAKAAGNHATRNIRRRDEVARRFKHDVKLQLDLECQARAEESIRSIFPKHAILGEEDPDGAVKPNAGAEFEWIIDPIDGTVNFSHGLPFWGCSVAVRRADKVLAGAVYCPILNELYTASADSPALLNGKRLRVSKIGKAMDAMILTGLDKNMDEGISPYATFERMWEHVQRGRIMGCAALDICRVATGQADAYYESGIYIWDVAAAGLIVQRAGGTVEVLGKKTGHSMSFLATNGRIHGEIRDILLCPEQTPASRRASK